jgi:hypothetical protein
VRPGILSLGRYHLRVVHAALVLTIRSEGRHKTQGTAVEGLLMSCWPSVLSGWILAKSISYQRSSPTSPTTRSIRRCPEPACRHHLGPKSRSTVTCRVSREDLSGTEPGRRDEHETACIKPCRRGRRERPCPGHRVPKLEGSWSKGTRVDDPVRVCLLWRSETLGVSDGGINGCCGDPSQSAGVFDDGRCWCRNGPGGGSRTRVEADRGQSRQG